MRVFKWLSRLKSALDRWAQIKAEQRHYQRHASLLRQVCAAWLQFIKRLGVDHAQL